MKKPILLTLLALLFLLISVIFVTKDIPLEKSKLVKVQSQKPSSAQVSRVSIIAENLEIPWSLAFLPQEQILFTERPGRVRLIDKNGSLLPSPIATISDVKHIGEGGLLGITAHPDFTKNNFVYLYYTYSSDGGNTLNKVVRYKFENNRLKEERIIMDKIPGAPNHNGGRIKFGPDKFLYIATGDAQNPSQAQDRNSLAGKILRVTDEGDPASDNPFDNPVYSYGHRNPQGLTFDNNGRLWETEHGQQAQDELNLIEKGANYGWPIIRGDEKEEGMKSPILHSRSSTWAPSGTAFSGNSIFFAGLRGNALFEAKILETNVELEEHLKGEFGRIRDVVFGPDGFLYLTTSNRDGRGTPDALDDRIIKINPAKL